MKETVKEAETEKEREVRLNSVEPLYCGLSTTHEQLDIITDFIASTAWDGDLPLARAKRLELCGLMQVDMQMRAPNITGECVQCPLGGYNAYELNPFR